MAYLWRTYPLATRWTLDTPAWNRRTRHFYSKMGFVEIGQDGRGGVHFERRCGPLAQAQRQLRSDRSG